MVHYSLPYDYMLHYYKVWAYDYMLHYHKVWA
jgi:hypothetical protein